MSGACCGLSSDGSSLVPIVYGAIKLEVLADSKFCVDKLFVVLRKLASEGCIQLLESMPEAKWAEPQDADRVAATDGTI